MKTKHLIKLCLMFIFFQGLLNISWSQKIVPFIWGEVVKDINGKKISLEKMKITLSHNNNESKPIYTSPSGIYIVYAIPGSLGNTFTLKIFSKNGLLIHKEAITIKAKKTKKNIVLPASPLELGLLDLKTRIYILYDTFVYEEIDTHRVNSILKEIIILLKNAQRIDGNKSKIITKQIKAIHSKFTEHVNSRTQKGRWTNSLLAGNKKNIENVFNIALVALTRSYY